MHTCFTEQLAVLEPGTKGKQVSSQFACKAL
jgi:hypothetical protein